MEPAQFDGYVRQGSVDTLSVADATRQLDAVTRYVAQARDDLALREKDGDSPALDAEKALAFAHEARSMSLTDATGETVAVVVSPAVLEVLEDALGLLQGELDRWRGTATPVTTEELRDELNGRMTS
ncbi:hypothetical protein GT204_18830 [Streptomyces sp. SID4919]|uniref:hypothetical protein n=1 Tax=unclassified Streptomyces TaxID=2593676 RepID=UPI000C085FBC|nr:MULTISPECIES: hypothetical protein [unclassified Streptomyces]MYY10910.1 hypothetical protein [Streptomyces sp. SID4919]